MANLRKLLAIALSGASLAEDPNREVAVDRLRAHAHSDPLGGALWSLRWANNAQAYTEALDRLTAKMTRIFRRENRKIMRKVCQVVLNEWLRDVCANCGGRRYIQATTTAATHVCTVCEGTGLARISDQARMAKLGMSKGAYAHWERYFWVAHQRIGEADTQAWVDTATWLGRNIGHATEKKLLAFQKDEARIFPITETVSHVSDDVDDVPAQTPKNMPGFNVSSSTATPPQKQAGRARPG